MTSAHLFLIFEFENHYELKSTKVQVYDRNIMSALWCDDQRVKIIFAILIYVQRLEFYSQMKTVNQTFI